MRSNREYDYFGNVLEYDYFPSYSSTSTQKVLEYKYKYTSTITPSLNFDPMSALYITFHTRKVDIFGKLFYNLGWPGLLHTSANKLCYPA